MKLSDLSRRNFLKTIPLLGFALLLSGWKGEEAAEVELSPILGETDEILGDLNLWTVAPNAEVGVMQVEYNPDPEEIAARFREVWSQPPKHRPFVIE